MSFRNIKKSKWLSLAPMFVMVPYMAYVFNNRFKDDYKRRDEIIAENMEKRAHVNAKSGGNESSSSGPNVPGGPQSGGFAGGL